MARLEGKVAFITGAGAGEETAHMVTGQLFSVDSGVTIS